MKERKMSFQDQALILLIDFVLDKTGEEDVYDTQWSRQVAAVQAALNEMGFDAGGVDGQLGPRTRAALQRWQERDAQEASQPDPVTPVATKSRGRKVAIVVGHNSRAQGAVRTTDRVSEFAYNSKLADDILKIAKAEGRGDDIKIFFRQAGLGYTREIDTVYAEVDRWNPDVILEFHFNAATATATGVEMLYAQGSAGGKALAQEVQNAVVNVLGLRDRGLKPLARGARGGRSVWAGKAPTVLTEWYFGSNASDCNRADARYERFAKAIWDSVK